MQIMFVILLYSIGNTNNISSSGNTNNVVILFCNSGNTNKIGDIIVSQCLDLF